MEVSTELAEQVDGLLSHASARTLTVTVDELRFQLMDARCGTDFIFGTHSGATYVIPLVAIRAAAGSVPPEQEEIKISEFLSAQKAPVRINYRAGGESVSSWLLNVNPPWLRLGTTSGVEWLPISAIDYARLETGSDSSRGVC